MRKMAPTAKAVNNPKSPVSFPSTAEILQFPHGPPARDARYSPQFPLVDEPNVIPLFGRDGWFTLAELGRVPPEFQCRSKSRGSVLAHKIEVTFFPSEKAQRKTADQLTLVELRDKIQRTTKPSKEKLPWLKLARFGDQRTDRNCLRSNANTEVITGIELDYDQKQPSFEDAIATLKQARLMTLVYTSARYTLDAPKWRLLLLPPERRAALVARVNGLFGGIFDQASFTLSQAYYYGGVGDNPSHRAEVVEGDYIDRRNDLDAGALGKGEKPKASSKADRLYDYGESTKPVRGFDGHLALLGDGDGLDGFNFPLNKATFAYVNEHGVDFDRDELKELLRDAIDDAPQGADRPAANIKRYKSDKWLDDSIDGAIKKYEAPAPDDDDNDIAGEPYDFPAEETLERWDFVYGTHLMRGEVAGTAASGGLGKSTWSIGEALAMASGKQLFHKQVPRPLRVLLINLEDNRATMSKRIAAAMRYHHLTPKHIGSRLFMKCKGELKFRANSRKSVNKLMSFVKDNQIDVVSIDPFVRTHDADENSNPAMQKVVEAYEDIALECNCAIPLWHHTRKGNGGDISVDSARGASSFVDACRSVRVLEPMSEKEAQAMRVVKRRGIFKSFSGKLNYSPMPEDCDWYHIVNVTLDNGPHDPAEKDRKRDLYYGPNGDNVGVAVEWNIPAPAELSKEQIEAINAKLGEGIWRDSVQAAQWAGNAIAPILGLDQERDKEQIRQTLKDLLRQNILKREFFTDEHRHERQVLVPKDWIAPPSDDQGGAA